MDFCHAMCVGGMKRMDHTMTEVLSRVVNKGYESLDRDLRRIGYARVIPSKPRLFSQQ